MVTHFAQKLAHRVYEIEDLQFEPFRIARGMLGLFHLIPFVPLTFWAFPALKRRRYGGGALSTFFILCPLR